jgi:hypothetical protein
MERNWTGTPRRYKGASRARRAFEKGRARDRRRAREITYASTCIAIPEAPGLELPSLDLTFFRAIWAIIRRLVRKAARRLVKKFRNRKGN